MQTGGNDEVLYCISRNRSVNNERLVYDYGRRSRKADSEAILGKNSLSSGTNEMVGLAKGKDCRQYKSDTVGTYG